MSDLPAENVALKVQLTQFYHANYRLNQQLESTHAELVRVSQLLSSVLIRNKAAADAMRSACMMMPITLAEAEYSFK